MEPIALPILWAQATGSSPGPGSLAPLALRRWCASLTLSSTELVPSFSGLWWGLAGLAALLGMAIVLQGPVRALGQLFDLPGHVRLVSQALRRLRRSSRVVVVTIGATVLAWTASQTASYHRPEGKDDLMLLTKSRSLGDLAVEGGIMAGLTPLRDVAGLGDNLPLLVAATILAFQATTRRWGTPDASAPALAAPARHLGWGALVCGGTALYALYRITSLVMGAGDIPLGGSFPPGAEALVIPLAVAIPLLMALADGLLLAWILAELREARPGGAGDAPFELWHAVGLMPAAALACVAALPARYVATGVLLGSLHLPSSAFTGPLGAFVRWQLGAGLTVLQAAALATAGLAGAVSWSGGTLGGAGLGYLRLLKAEAGHLVAALALASLAAGIVAAVSYAIVLALPPQTWVLAAADSYSHYATLPIGLLTLAALVELGERAASTVKRAGVDADASPS